MILGQHRITEDHEKAADNTQITEEEIEVENKAIAKTLNNHNEKESSESVFGVFFEDNGAEPNKHDLMRVNHDGRIAIMNRYSQ